MRKRRIIMTRHEREITKEQYERAVANRGYITKEDELQIFSASELYGYGVYSPIAHMSEGKYTVHFLLGSTCD